MIVLDTNVLAEVMKSQPSARVSSFLVARDSRTLFITSVTQAEILHGIFLLPEGRRRRALEAAAATMFETAFDGRILPFGSEAAVSYAHIAVARRRAGKPISHFDAQIAAIARSLDASVATRNVEDFQGCGVHVIDPWVER